MRVGAFLITTRALTPDGVRTLRTSFLERLTALCHRLSGVAVIADETETCGFTRGSMFAFRQHADYFPDYVMFGPPLGDGFGLASRDDLPVKHQDLKQGGGMGLSTVTVEPRRCHALLRTLAHTDRGLDTHVAAMTPVLRDGLTRLQNDWGARGEAVVDGTSALVTVPSERAAQLAGVVVRSSGELTTVRLEFPVAMREPQFAQWLSEQRVASRPQDDVRDR